MKHRGPASSLRPAREAARQQERVLAHENFHPAGGSGGSPGRRQLGSWQLTSDEHDRLVAVHPSGTRVVLAEPAPDHTEES